MSNIAAVRYKSAQQTLWGEAGVWAHDTFVAHNEDYFDNEVPHRGIAWGLTPYGGRLGHCAQDGRITLHPALLDPHSNAWNVEPLLGQEYASDVMLHEMIHAYLFDQGVFPPPSKTNRKNSHHTMVEWCEEIMRLAPLLGLGKIKAEPVKSWQEAREGHLEQKEITHFPHTLRPASHYTTAGRLWVRI